VYRENDGFFSNDQTMRLNFDTSYTRGPNDNSPAAPNNLGQSVAALLLGIPSSSNTYISRTADYAEQSTTWGFYVQDDWKATQKLTLNLGLRLEFETPLTERYNRSVKSFDPNYVPPFTAAAIAAYAANQVPGAPAQLQVRGGLTYADGGLYHTPKNNFLPRVGLAYQLSTNTVVRTGFGMYSGFLGERRGDVIQTGYTRQTPFNAFAPDNVTVVNTLSNPFPNGVLEPVGSAQGPLTNIGQNIAFFNQNPKIPVNYRWQFGVQHQLRGFLLEAAYVGNKGVRYEITRNLNALPDQYLSTLPARDNATNAFLTAAVANPFAGLPVPQGTPSGFTAQTASRQSLLLPYPQFGAVNSTSNQGYSWYHALQLRAERRFSRGFTANFNYTLSKLMQATELLNAGDPLPTRMISDQDVPHRFAATAIVQLPFGQGRRFGSNFGPVLSRIVGGWEATALWTLQSGTPLSFGSYSATTATNNGDFFFAGDPSSIVLPLDQRTPEHWFNAAGFVTASTAQPVSHLRVNPYRYSWLRGPRQFNFDASLIKDTAINDRFRLRFNAQALNALNHPQFPTPQLSFTAATFGQITSSTQANYPRRLQLELKLIF